MRLACFRKVQPQASVNEPCCNPTSPLYSTLPPGFEDDGGFELFNLMPDLDEALGMLDGIATPPPSQILQAQIVPVRDVKQADGSATGSSQNCSIRRLFNFLMRGRRP